MNTALVTGGGSGIGREITLALAKQGIKVYIAGRRLENLKETQSLSDGAIECIVADVSSEEGWQLVHQTIVESQLHYLVHNAAMAEPLRPLAKVEPHEWRQHMAVNLDAPMFLTQRLLDKLSCGSRILNISSGLAHYTIGGAGVYSISKAGLLMLHKVWQEEWSELGILAGSIMPGAVDTPMQDTIRDSKHGSEFQSQDFFRNLKSDGMLLPAKSVGCRIANMLVNMSDQDFCSKEWDIDDGEVIGCNER